jgi:S-disulfanyl-L-cysteine oxidoreductase SoxD
MSTYKGICAAILFCLGPAMARADDAEIHVGTPVSSEELAKFFAIQPDGATLPPGQGTAAAGRDIYAQRCGHCHGEHLEGIKELGGPALTGGRGSLATDKPLKTVESYWPYASTLFDYIWRTMPFDQPGSLTPDEVYSLSAYIMSVGKVIDDRQVLNAKTLPKTVMPNAKGFFDGSGPELDMYRISQPETPAK